MHTWLPGIFFLSGIVSFSVVVFWTIVNENLGASAGSVGLLAMKSTEKEAPRATKQRKSRWSR